MSKKSILYLVAASIIALIVAISAWIYANTRTIVINFDNVSSAAVYSDDTQIRSIDQTGQQVRLFNTGEVTIRYNGSEGYANGVYYLADNETEITLSPDFSRAGKDAHFSRHRQTILSELAANYQNTNRYSVLKTDSKERGKWVFILLKYNGAPGLSSDNQRVVLENVDDEWIVRAGPDIVLTKYNSPNIDTNILRQANSLR